MDWSRSNLFHACLIGIGILCSFPALTDIARAEDPVKLQEGTWKDVEAFVAQHKGKVVIVDIWSMSCAPCMKEFPGLVALHGQYPRDVVCLSFNVDYSGLKNKPPAFYAKRVEEFLNKEKASFTNILCSEAADEVFEKLELSSIPAVYVFGRDGKLARRFDDSLYEDGEEDAFTYKTDINPFIAELVGNTADKK